MSRPALWGTEAQGKFCVICMRRAAEDELTAVLPDGCRAHERCWLKADYEDVRVHARGGTS